MAFLVHILIGFNVRLCCFLFYSVMWEPMGDGKKIISLADNNILLWDLQESSAEAVVRNSFFFLQIMIYLTVIQTTTFTNLEFADF